MPSLTAEHFCIGVGMTTGFDVGLRVGSETGTSGATYGF